MEPVERARMMGLAVDHGVAVSLGEVDAERAAALYADADIFALASVYEGYGMVFAEALAHGEDARAAPAPRG